jgi:adenylyltransferase/sulfurtransferase
MLTDKERIRYNRQLILPEYTEEHQQKLKESKILVVGAGGLGSVVLTYLSRTGIGTIGVVEFDKVDETNLHRQVLYNETEIDETKLEIAIKKLQAGNSNTSFIKYNEALNEENANRIFTDYDIIADCTDNFSTRYLINDISAKLEKPVVFASVANYEGQVTILNYKKKVNYRDIFSEKTESTPIKGVLPTLLPIIGGIQANEAIKIITGLGENLDGKLLIYNILNNTQYTLNIK